MTSEPLTLNAVFVAWRDPIQHRCYPIGRLSRADHAGSEEYEFAYVQGVRKANAAGFTSLASFENLNQVYWSRTLFPFFANRIISNSRPDRAVFLEHLRLQNPDPLELLARTGGIRATDSYEVFPLPRFDAAVPGFRTLFLAHALRQLKQTAHDRIKQLGVGERLFFMHDCQNSFDPKAIALRTEDRCIVGYVPNYLLLEVYTLSEQCDLDFTVAKVNPLPAPLDQRLLCELRACWPSDYRPFVDGRFQPYHLQRYGRVC